MYTWSVTSLSFLVMNARYVYGPGIIPAMGFLLTTTCWGSAYCWPEGWSRSRSCQSRAHSRWRSDLGITLDCPLFTSLHSCAIISLKIWVVRNCELRSPAPTHLNKCNLKLNAFLRGSSWPITLPATDTSGHQSGGVGTAGALAVQQSATRWTCWSRQPTGSANGFPERVSLQLNSSNF